MSATLLRCPHFFHTGENRKIVYNITITEWNANEQTGIGIKEQHQAICMRLHIFKRIGDGGAAIDAVAFAH